jgi:hypothetical protein
LYLAAILDVFSRFVVGWAISTANDRHLTLSALRMALNRRYPEAGLLHHSDRGCTYASADYQRQLEAHGITCSMSRTGDCYDNAVMEAFFATVKNELTDRFDSSSQAKRELFEYVEVFYNQQRRHSSIGYMSPAVFEERAQGRGNDRLIETVMAFSSTIQEAPGATLELEADLQVLRDRDAWEANRRSRFRCEVANNFATKSGRCHSFGRKEPVHTSLEISHRMRF